MSRIAYVNGRYVGHAEASVHIEDRGYQFSDGVYEVAAVCGGHLVDEEPHLDRLARSLHELDMAMPMSRGALRVVSREVLRRNRIADGMLYLQVSRGVAARDHKFPAQAESALVMTARAVPWPADADTDGGVEVVSLPDIRWTRRDIKSISLLPNVLAKQTAHEAGAGEAWLVDDAGQVTEGSSTNAWIVDQGGRVITRELGHHILGGITRARVLALAAEQGIPVIERSFGIEEAKSAREAFLTSTTAFVRGVVGIDGARIGDGTPGPVTRTLRRLYLAYCRGPRANA